MSHLYRLIGLVVLFLAACSSGNGATSSETQAPPIEVTLAPGVNSILVPPTLSPTEPLNDFTPTPASGLVTLTNQSSWDVCFVYISDPQQTTWGQNWLDIFDMVVPGSSRGFNPPPGEYDLRAEDCNYIVMDERYNVDVTDGYDWQVHDPAILYYDEFNDPGGWKAHGNGGDGGIVDTTYVMNVNRAGGTVYATAGLKYKDLVVTVEATPTESNNNSQAVSGVMCRVQPNGDGYLFLVRNDGQYGIFKEGNGQQTPLVDWTPSDDINQEDNLNVVESHCIGDKLSIRINGITQQSVTDGSFTSGDVGLYAAQMGEGNAKVMFDFFSVTGP